MSWSRALLNFFFDAFRPPYRTAPWIVLLYAVLSVIYNGDSHFNQWSLPDTDDYMRLNQMLAWLNGQSWFDLNVPHLYPQHPIEMHWARLPDLLLAGIFLTLKNIALFFRWEASQQAVAILTAFFAPMFMLAALLFLMPRLARPVLGRRMAGIICFMIPLCGQLIFQFMPMRVDHHAYILLSATVAFFCLQAFALHVRARPLMALAGFSFALGMWNGAEIIPMLVFFCMALTALLVAERRNFSAAAIFGGCLLAANFVVLFIARAPAQRWSLEYDAFSFFYVILAALVAAYFAVMFVVSLITKNRAVLSAAAIFTGLSGVALLLHSFPDFINGPYAKANPILEQIFFPNIREAIPLFQAVLDVGDTFGTSPKQGAINGLFYISTRMFISLAGIIASLWLIASARTSVRQKRLWALYAFFSIAYAILAMAWEVRVITYAQLFAIIPLTAAMLRYLKTLPRYYAGRRLYMFEMVAVFAFTLFPTIILPSMLTQARFMPDMMFFLGKNVESPCDNRLPVISYFHDLYDRSKKPVTVMTTLDYTPELMFYTQDNFIAAPYHRDDRGIIDMVTFFRSRPDDTTAKTIAKRLGIDYVLMCKASSFSSTLNKGSEVGNMMVTFNGNKPVYSPNPNDVKKSSLAMRLAHDAMPNWLELRDIPMNTDFLLFQVKKDRLGTGAPDKAAKKPR